MFTDARFESAAYGLPKEMDDPSNTESGAAGSAQRPAAGWYDDPEAAGQRRYWDGSRWTAHRAPGATTARPVPVTARRPAARRPWYRSPGIWAAIGVCTVVVAIGGVVLGNLVSTANKRSDASAELSRFEHRLASVHNSAIVEGKALIRCWNVNVSPEEAAAACGSSCNSCTRTAAEEAKRLRSAYRDSPGYVRNVYRDLYRIELRHLAALAAMGKLTKRALNVVPQGDAAVFYQYQGEALDQNRRVNRIEEQVQRVAKRARVKRKRYLEGL